MTRGVHHLNVMRFTRLRLGELITIGSLAGGAGLATAAVLEPDHWLRYFVAFAAGSVLFGTVGFVFWPRSLQKQLDTAVPLPDDAVVVSERPTRVVLLLALLVYSFAFVFGVAAIWARLFHEIRALARLRRSGLDRALRVRRSREYAS